MQFLDEVKIIDLDETEVYQKSTMTIEKVIEQASKYLHKENSYFDSALLITFLHFHIDRNYFREYNLPYLLYLYLIFL